MILFGTQLPQENIVSMKAISHAILIMLMSAFVSSGSAPGQQAMRVRPPQQTSGALPFQVRPVAYGVEVVSYSGTDRLLQLGDVISWVATPDSTTQSQVTTTTNFEREVVARKSQDGTIALWVTRGNAEPYWVFVKLAAVPAPPQLPLVVRQGNGGVEVVTYNGVDRMLRQGDLISWVATPGVDNQVEVNSSAEFEAEAAAKLAADGSLALWVTRNNANPDWVIANLSPIANQSKPRTGGGLWVAPNPPSTISPGSTGTTTANAGFEDDTSVLHVLNIYDPNAQLDSFRWGCEFDVYRMEAYLSGSVPRLSMHTFATPSQDAAGLLAHIRSYKDRISPNDTLLIYYSGHGSNDAQDGQTLDLRPGVKVGRTGVRKAMQDTGARLCVLITDCCASGSKEPFGTTAPAHSGFDYSMPYWNTNICRALFFRHTGFVDVTSCGPGELAWSVGPTDENNSFSGKEPTDGDVFEDGGLFTTSLLEILAMHDGELQEEKLMDRQGRITWDSIKNFLAEKTEKRFQERIYSGFRKQRDRDRNKHQTVTFMSTGQPAGLALPTTSQSKFGVEFVGGPNGVVAGNLDPQQTPAWVGIHPDDRLLSVRRADDFYAHFWQDKKFTNGSTGGTVPVSINGLADFQRLNTPANEYAPPTFSSGLWVFSVERNGQPIEVPVRITEPSVFRR